MPEKKYITVKISKFLQIRGTINRTLKLSKVQKHTRLKMYNILALPTLLYRCKIWVIREQDNVIRNEIYENGKIHMARSQLKISTVLKYAAKSGYNISSVISCLISCHFVAILMGLDVALFATE